MFTLKSFLSVQRVDFTCLHKINAVETTIENYLKSLNAYKSMIIDNRDALSSLKNPRSITPAVLVHTKNFARFYDSSHLIISRKTFRRIENDDGFTEFIEKIMPNVLYIAVVTTTANTRKVPEKPLFYEVLDCFECISTGGVYLAVTFLRNLRARFCGQYDYSTFLKAIKPLKKDGSRSLMMHSYLYGLHYKLSPHFSAFDQLFTRVCGELDAYKHYEELLDQQSTTGDFRRLEAYLGSTGKQSEKDYVIKCKIVHDTQQLKHWARVEYIKRNKRLRVRMIQEGDVIATVKVNQIFEDINSVPEYIPRSSIVPLPCCTDRKQHNFIGVLDLDSPLAYIHDRPDFISSEHRFIEVSIDCVKLVDNTFKANVRATSQALADSTNLLFKSRSSNDMLASDHDRFLTDCAQNGWPWAEFVVYHRGYVKDLPKYFKTVRYPTSTYGQKRWYGSFLRVKKDTNPRLGWGVVSTKPLELGTHLVPFAGPPTCGRQYRAAANSDEKFRDFALTYRVYGDFEWGVSNYMVGTIARYMNHSCNGNTLVDFCPDHGGYFKVYATQNVPPQTPLTYDYGGSKPDEACKCGIAINFLHECDRFDVKKRWVRNNINNDLGKINEITIIHKSRETTAPSVDLVLHAVNVDDIAFNCRQGSGTYGECWNVHHEGKQRVFKVFKTKDNKTNDFFREAYASFVLKNAKNYFSKVIAYSERYGKPALLFDFVGPHHLSKFHSKNRMKFLTMDWKSSWLTRLNVCTNLLKAVEEMHKHSIVHNDLHAGNVLFDDENNVYIIDFGSSFTLNKSSKYSEFLNYTECTHVENEIPLSRYSDKYFWLAPESLSCKKCNHFSADVVAVGFLLILILFGDNVYDFVRHFPNARTLPLHFKKGKHFLGLPFEVENMIDTVGT